MSPEIPPEDAALLLRVAHTAIEKHLQGEPYQPSVEHFPESLRAPGCSFVTLTKDGDLRGCIGRLDPVTHLVHDVADNARKAATQDPRFSAVRLEELDGLRVEVSVLLPQEPVEFSSDEDLITQLVPGEHGLAIESGPYRATFLPSVWEMVPDPARFLWELKRKAGLDPAAPLPAGTRAHRYRSQKVA